MKTPLLILFSLSLLVAAHAQSGFPGLKSVMTEAEWKRAGLDRLTPDQIGVIDAALIRQQAGINAQHLSELNQVKQSAPAAATSGTPPSMWERFGIPFGNNDDWRAQPALKGKVVKWETPNRFLLDNGQAWEGMEPIIYDLVNKEVEIQARPHGQFALVVDGINTTIRVTRRR